jgi:NodT family efflux transporter outer membrane factor (OMF) lipoprotein
MRLRLLITRGGPVLPGALALAACAPSVTLPDRPGVVSEEWRQPLAGEATAAPVERDLGASLGAPELEILIARAAERNADVAAAAARVGQARSQLGIARAAMLPVVTGSAGVRATQTDNQGGPVFNFSDAFGGLDISYDVDLFGGASAGRRAARARFAAAAFDRDALALIVETEVARTFVQHAALSDRIALLDRNIEQARELERIIRVRLRAGDATRVDVGLQTIQVRELEAERIRLLEALGRSRTAMAVLVGEEAPLFQMPAATLSDLRLPSIALVQPGDLLVRRPDVRAAEARIHAAEGDVGEARAAFLPRLRLSASALGQAATLSGPVGATLAIGADLLAPIFNRRRLRGQLGVATAVQRETVELYRSALLGALGEAENALAASEQARAREDLLVEIVAEATTTARLARRQYLEGEVDLQWVLDAEQLLVRAQDARAVVRQERLEAAIDLYKALGGRPRADALVLESR